MARTDPPVKTGVSFEDYLEFERTSEVKHEFVDGQLFMMAGTSDRHNRIAGRIYAALLAAEASPCRTYFADMKLKVSDDKGYYPDVLVVCDDADDEPYFKKNPCLIIEVLSDSTEAIDRGEKLHNYRKFASLQAYVLVNQKEQRTEVFRRDGDVWLYEEKEAEDTLELPCVGLELSVSDLYTGI